MTSSEEPASGAELRGLPSVERSVLRALCLTVNVAGSAVKDNILDTLTKDQFSLPITKGLFAALGELHQKGEYVVLRNLEDELRALAVEIPAGLSLEELFRGEPPKPSEVKDWIDQLAERSVKGKPSIPRRVSAQQAPAAPTSQTLSAPAVARDDDPSASSRGDSLARARAAVEARTPAAEVVKPSKPKAARDGVGEGKSRTVATVALSSEAEEWTSYLQQIAAKQGKILETGFSGLDDPAGGLSPGLMLVVDQDSGRLGGFLKQLTDQIAARSKAPCLYVSFGLPKSVLRIRTLSRLSGVPSRDLEKGRIKKGSPEWASVEQNGRGAAEWLKWVFIVHGEAEMDFEQIREMGRELLESKGATTCLVVVDSLDRMGKRAESPHALVAGLKDVSESLDVLVIAATTNKALLSEPGVDFLATLGEARGAVQFEIIRAEDSRPTIVRFEYRPDIHRFTEQPAS